MFVMNKKTKLLIIICITFVGVYFSFRFILPLFTPFIIAYFFSWILQPLVRFLHIKIRMPRLSAAVLSLITVGGLLIWCFGFVGNLFIAQIITLIKNMPIYFTILGSKVDSFCTGFDKLLGIEDGTMRGVINDNIDGILIIIRTKVMPSLTTASFHIVMNLVGFVGIILIIVVTILLLLKDSDKYKESFKNNYYYKDIHLVTGKLSETGIAYLRTQSILVLIISSLCFVGLLLIGNKYALLIGIGIGIFDAFPILGSGLILVPWSLIELINQDVYSAAILLTLYLVCQIVRQFLEPKLLGNKVGLKPVYTLMSMYVGLELFGFIGFFLGPIGLIIIVTIIKEAANRLNLYTFDSF